MIKVELDVKRLLCPLPVIRAQNKIKELKVGDVLRVTGTDPGMLADIPAWCRIHGHSVVFMQQIGWEIIIELKKEVE